VDKRVFMANLVFFGTPDFSLPSLNAIIKFCQASDHHLSLVVCQPDRPQHRGQKFLSPPVKKFAQKLGIKVLQPQTLKKDTKDGDSFFDQFSGLDIELAIVIAYGRILPERLLAIPQKGFVNIHASLLPRFRGAAPIQRAIQAGDNITGVCLMDVVKKLDEGDIYACQKTPILPYDTAETLFYRLANLGAHLLYNKLDEILCEQLEKKPQAETGVVYAPMLEKSEGLLNFNQPAREISYKVRAFDPWPGAYGFIRGKRVKFFDSFFIDNHQVKKDIAPGTVVTTEKFLGVKALEGIVYFQNMQIEGKKTMPIKEFLSGFPISIGEVISSSSNDS
jgi:methionyl-tRNA formyltransferase